MVKETNYFSIGVLSKKNDIFNLMMNLKGWAQMEPLRNLCLVSFIVLVFSLMGCADQDTDNTEDSSKSATMDKNTVAGSVHERLYSPSFGPESAKVTIVEFFDPACESCKAFYPFLKEIMSRHPADVRLVLRYATLHQDSETVVRMLEASRLQNVFEAVLDALMDKQEEWASHRHPNVNRAWEIAESVGLNIEAAKAVMHSAEINNIIMQEMQDLMSLEVQQTPTFFVNKKPLPSFGAQQLYTLVVSELNRDH